MPTFDAAASSPSTPPRVLLFSSRVADAARWHAPQYEFEDVIADVDDVRMLAPRSLVKSELREMRLRLANNVRRRILGARKEPVTAPSTVDGEYDLFFGVFHFPEHLAFLDRIKGWRERSRKAICWVVEFWSPEVERDRAYLKLLEQFDHVFVFNPVIMSRVTEITGVPCSYLAAGVDALRFSPYPSPAPRLIDVYTYGRRSPEAHRQLVEMAERREIYYVYDTMSQSGMLSFREHRLLVANTARRSRYAFSYRINDSETRVGRTGGDEGLTTRLFELTAAGCVLLGTPSPCREYEELFDWPDATIEVPYEPPDIRATLAELDAQPERIAAARRNNVVNALRRHDWAYRWAHVLETAGLATRPALAARVEQLRAQAADVDADAVTDSVLV